VYFAGKEKGLVLNKTNANMIVEIAGSDETEDWEGVQIVLYSTRVDFQGRRVDAIRVDYPVKHQRQPGGNGRRVNPPARPEQPPADDLDAPPLDDDQIPF
jgi:hypothetical protein